MLLFTTCFFRVIAEHFYVLLNMLLQPLVSVKPAFREGASCPAELPFQPSSPQDT